MNTHAVRRTIRPFVTSVASFAALLAVPVATFGQARVFMLEEGADPNGTPPGTTVITAEPGQALTIYVWLQDPIGIDSLNAYQLAFPCLAGGGADGMIAYIDNNPGMGGGNSITIDKDNPDWIFFNAPPTRTFSFAYENCPSSFEVIYNYLPGAGIEIGPRSMVPHPGQPNYIAQFDLQVSPDACGTFTLPFNIAPSPPPLAAIYNDLAGLYGGPTGIIFVPLEIVVCCQPLSDCADVAPIDGVRDDACLWYECFGTTCETVVKSSQADLGGAFGSCAIDDTCDANDFFHALNCFSNSNTVGTPGYPCEESTPAAVNVDAGGPATCQLDGVCDGNDAFHTLHCFGSSWFDGSVGYQCACTGPSPSPARPQEKGASRSRSLPRPPAAGLTLQAPATARPGALIAVDVHLDEGVKALRGYQLHLGARDGATAGLELVDISIDTRRRDYAFAKAPQVWSAYNRDSAQMVAGMNEPEGIAVRSGSYLATFSYRVPPDARGAFRIELRHGGDAPATTERTFLFGRHAELINIASAADAHVAIADVK
jgi:hypothetical protein